MGETDFIFVGNGWKEVRVNGCGLMLVKNRYKSGQSVWVLT